MLALAGMAADSTATIEFDGKSRPTQTIGFIVKIKSTFYQFFLFVPRQDWAANREQYLALFKSLRISS